ncbi:glycosyl transferase [Nitrosopumilus zosterae]|uniref:Glycosyl transferase n=1 Tax=Nitrosopumilus zosterae TaxID=718286 RepID=A0A2S2KU50_9ARCH|nr:glycosyltransferase family 2 protein [Nitrosopumilus zosterae]BDQ31809.1 glycosyltransferase family 2 protein [Nitrosopumilus zosterae]GBH35159.1 glycosyl transferase [Nitrosopumilus zosterae]
MIEINKDKHTESHNPLVSIIILNYNAGNLLVDCINSIQKSTYTNFEIILVDNVSKDNSHIICKEKFPTIKLIENSENLGYCEGNNVGLRKANGEFMMVLNPDTIVDSQWLEELLNAYQTNGEGIYQPKFLAITDHSMLLSTGNMIQIFGFGFSRSKGNMDKKQFENIEKIDYVSGTCLFTSKKVLKKIGLFDPFLFAFHDDLELCWRAALIKINSFYVPKSIVYHPIEGTSFKWSPLKFKLMERNRKYCLLTLYDRKTLLKMIPGLFLVDIAVFFFYLKKGLVKMKISADVEILQNFKIINQKYSQNQKIKIISDKEIIQHLKNKVDVPNWIVDTKTNHFFNSFLNRISKITRMII